METAPNKSQRSDTQKRQIVDPDAAIAEVRLWFQHSSYRRPS
jgi:hypothetical protein